MSCHRRNYRRLGAEMFRTDGERDRQMTKLIDSFRNFSSMFLKHRHTFGSLARDASIKEHFMFVEFFGVWKFVKKLRRQSLLFAD